MDEVFMCKLSISVLKFLASVTYVVRSAIVITFPSVCSSDRLSMTHVSCDNRTFSGIYINHLVGQLASGL